MTCAKVMAEEDGKPSVRRMRAKYIAFVLLACGLPLLPAAPPSEASLIKDLASRLPVTVVGALNDLENLYPASTNARPAIKKLLVDKRPAVRRKAARVLGSLHAQMDQTDLDNLCAMLKSSDANEVTDALMALSGLDVPQVIPQILPFLKNANTHLVRDACRALAALGNKDTIPIVEPLLHHAEPAVQKDAQDAIFKLKAKP